MQFFEIRFYVNISSYQEYKLDGSGELFPEDMVYHFWEEDALFPLGAYAIRYSSSVCILSYLTEVSPELGWRNNRIRIAVALHRPKELSHPLEVFDGLLHHFQELAKTNPDLSLLQEHAAALDEVVARDLVPNPDQLVYGRSSGEKAVTAYRRKEELAALLAHPFRPEFENVAVLYILPQQEAARLWSVLKSNFKAITEVKYEDNPDIHKETPSALESEAKPEVVLEKTEKTEEIKPLSSNNDEAFSMLKVTFNIENARLCQELAESTNKVYLEWKWQDEATFEEKKTFAGVDITQPSYTIVLPANRMYTFTLQAKGYRKYTIQRNYICADKLKDGDEDVISVIFKRFPYKKLVLLMSVLLVVLSTVFSIGILIGKKQGRQDVFFGEYTKLKRDYIKLEKENKRLKLEKEKENVQESSRISVESVFVKKKALSEEKLKQSMTLGHREVLVKKLQGINFTSKDIQELKNVNPDTQEKRLIRSCEASFRLLNVTMKEKRRARKEILEMDGFMYYLYRNLTVPEHKKAMDEIIFGRYARAYEVTAVLTFKSIQDAMDRYEKLLTEKQK